MISQEFKIMKISIVYRVRILKLHKIKDVKKAILIY